MGFMTIKIFSKPGYVPENSALVVRYALLCIIFPLDVISGSEISLHILYVFPLFLAALHSERRTIVYGAASLSVLFQVATLASYNDISILSKFVVSIIIFTSNFLIVFVAHSSRMSFLEAERLANHDALTNLLNRRSLDFEIEKEAERQKRYGGYFSIALVDLDGFKGLNDSRGHLEGDKALKILADVLRENTRQPDTVARIGGDEFVVLMPNTQAVDCISFCKKLNTIIADRMSEATFEITASIGCTTFNQPPAFPEQILKYADDAMYAAKSKGKGCVVSL